MPITKIEFIAPNKGRRCIFTEHCMTNQHTVRLEGQSYKENKIIDSIIYNKYKKLALKT